MEIDLQYSASTAVKVASKVTGVNLDRSDVSFVISAPAEIVGGQSAGAAMTVITIAAIKNQQVKNDVVITGTIREVAQPHRRGQEIALLFFFLRYQF